MKKWLLALTALIILLAAGVIMLLFSVNSIVEKAVNTEGPKITDTSVHLDKADISLLSGKGVFSGLTVGNPAGFGGGHAAKAGSIAVALDTSTVLKDVIIVRSISIDSPEIVYELNRETSNFDVILKNIQNYADRHESRDGAASAATGENGTSRKKVIIDELVIRNARATLAVPLLRLRVDVPLPEIRLTDIGRRESGATFAGTALIVMKEVSRTLAEVTKEQTKNAGAVLLRDGAKAEDKAKTLIREGLRLFK